MGLARFLSEAAAKKVVSAQRLLFRIGSTTQPERLQQISQYIAKNKHHYTHHQLNMLRKGVRRQIQILNSPLAKQIAVGKRAAEKGRTKAFKSKAPSGKVQESMIDDSRNISGSSRSHLTDTLPADFLGSDRPSPLPKGLLETGTFRKILASSPFKVKRVRKHGTVSHPALIHPLDRQIVRIKRAKPEVVKKSKAYQKWSQATHKTSVEAFKRDKVKELEEQVRRDKLALFSKLSSALAGHTPEREVPVDFNGILAKDEHITRFDKQMLRALVSKGWGIRE